MAENGIVDGSFKVKGAAKFPEMIILTQISLMKLECEHVMHLCNLVQQINHSTHIYVLCASSESDN